jgi:hypothetical protein
MQECSAGASSIVDIASFNVINKEMQEYDEMRETVIKDSRGVSCCSTYRHAIALYFLQTV